MQIDEGNAIPGQLANAQSSRSLSSEAIQEFLSSKLADLLKIGRDEIDVSKTYEYYGLSSMESVLLIADLEEFLGRALDATLLWDYPTIQSLANYLANEK